MESEPWKNINWRSVSMQEIDALVNQGADVNQKEYIQFDRHKKMESTPLFCAIVNNNLSAVVGLLKNKANPNADLSLEGENSPKVNLMDTVTNPLILKYMIRCGGKINPQKLINLCHAFLTTFETVDKKIYSPLIQIMWDYFQSDKTIQEKLIREIELFKNPFKTKQSQITINRNKQQLLRKIIGKKSNLRLSSLSHGNAKELL